METGGTTIASAAFTFIDFGIGRGLDRVRLLAIAGISDELRADPDARVSDLVMVRLWMELLAALPGVAIPIEVVRASRQVPLGILGAIVKRASTVRDLLALGMRYLRLTDSDCRAEQEPREDGLIGLRIRHRPEVEAMGLPMETIFGWMFRQLCEALGHPLQLREVTFAHPARYPVAEYEAFFGAPVRFGAPSSALWIEPAVLDQSLAAPEPELRRWLEAQAARMLEDIPPDEDPFRTRLRVAILEDLADGAELPRVAKKLAVSTRTLQRRLAEQGTSFQALVDEVRAREARRLLRRRERSILDVAFELGYADLASFYRAFKRWTGCTPAEWRADPRS